MLSDLNDQIDSQITLNDSLVTSTVMSAAGNDSLIHWSGQNETQVSKCSSLKLNFILEYYLIMKLYLNSSNLHDLCTSFIKNKYSLVQNSCVQSDVNQYS